MNRNLLLIAAIAFSTLLLASVTDSFQVTAQNQDESKSISFVITSEIDSNSDVNVESFRRVLAEQLQGSDFEIASRYTLQSAVEKYGKDRGVDDVSLSDLETLMVDSNSSLTIAQEAGVQYLIYASLSELNQDGGEMRMSYKVFHRDGGNHFDSGTIVTSASDQLLAGAAEKLLQKITKKDDQKRRAAIFVKNRAGDELADKSRTFEDFVVGEVTDLGFQVISREDTIQAVGDFVDNPGENTGRDLDALLDNNTTGLRLAQKLQANFLIIAAISSYGKQDKKIQFRDVDRSITEHSLRVSYKILDGIRGSSLSSGTVRETKRVQQSDTLQSTSSDLLNTLLSGAATKIGKKLEEKGGASAIAEQSSSQQSVKFEVTCEMQGLSLPAVVQSDNGEYSVSESEYQLQVANANVSVDGTVVGSTPGTFQVKPGLHKLRVTRNGFQDWERTIQVTGNQQTISVKLTPTNETMKRWRKNAQFMQNLKTKSKLTDAEVERIEGIAQMFRQSGYRINVSGKADNVDLEHGTTDIIVPDHD